MGNIRKTVSYLKRNGLVKTCYRIIEQKKIDAKFSDYNEKRKADVASSEELKQQSEYKFDNNFMISVVVPLYRTNEEYLRVLLDSVLLQSYENWELLLPDGSGNDSCALVVSEYDDERIKHFMLSSNQGISENTNAGIQKATGDILLFLDHDDYIEPDAFFYIAKAFDNGALAVYTDEDKVKALGDYYFMPHRKLAFNYDLLLSNNYICHIFAVNKSIADKVGLLRREYDGAQDFDFVIRCVEEIAKINGGYANLDKYIVHIPKILYHWRSHELSTSDNPESKLYAYEAGRNVIKAHLKRRKIAAVVEHTDHLGFYHITYEDIFQRSEVGAYIGRRKGLKKYTSADGPYIRNNKGMLYNPYEGLKVYESGYMHRAKMQVDVDDGWRDNAIIRTECEHMQMEDIVKAGYLLVYDPEKLI